ncbi:hypothetical protein ES703_52107 [subsurface metagenome]
MNKYLKILYILAFIVIAIYTFCGAFIITTFIIAGGL